MHKTRENGSEKSIKKAELDLIEMGKPTFFSKSLYKKGKVW